jgi:uncharacterized protein
VNFPDVNVMVGAFHKRAAHHDACAAWLDKERSDAEPLAVSTLVLSAVIRISTNTRIFDPPETLDAAVEFADALLTHSNCIAIEPGQRHWRIFCRLCSAANARGNLITDAWFAALAMEHGCTLVSLDRDFGKFPGLRTASPLIVG